MTKLERLIHDVVARTTPTTMAAATETIAEEMAREILRDEDWRAEMRFLIKRHFSASIAALAQRNGTTRRKRARRKAARS